MSILGWIISRLRPRATEKHSDADIEIHIHLWKVGSRWLIGFDRFRGSTLRIYPFFEKPTIEEAVELLKRRMDDITEKDTETP